MSRDVFIIHVYAPNNRIRLQAFDFPEEAAKEMLWQAMLVNDRERDMYSDSVYKVDVHRITRPTSI